MIKCLSSLLPKEQGGLAWSKYTTKDIVVTFSY